MACRALVTLLLHCLALLLAAPVLAAPNHITARLVAEGPAPAGATVTLALAMEPQPDWHGYWQNPGDAGLDITLDWQLPPGASAGKPQYPVPETLLIAGLMNHVYEHSYAVLIPFTVPASAAPGSTLPVRLKARWLACTNQICVPEEAELATGVSVGPASAPAPQFDKWRQALPAPLGSAARFTMDGNRLRLAIPLPASLPVENPHLFLIEDQLVDYAAPQTFSRSGDLLIVEVPRARFDPVTPDQLSAVLRLGPAGDGVKISAGPGSVPPTGQVLTASTAAPALSLPLLLVMALAGGLLLNVMPCVFPILSLKALSLVRAGESAAQDRSEGLAYTAGVVLACLALGGTMLALRAAGQEIGWAFQLQEPLVLAGLLLLAVAITANLAGLYEFAVPGFADTGSPQHGTGGAFATGLLAAFVATPCTGPFMAAAMGAALLLPVAQALLLFAALGLGLALPFLAIAWLPALRRLLPKPGKWMAWFKILMAVPMGLTAAALVWLAWRTGGTGFVAILVVSAVALLILLAVFGRRQRRGKAIGPFLMVELAAILAMTAIALPLLIDEPKAGDVGLPGSVPFSEATLATARASGKPVFVYFTADWCLTCKVNERTAIDREVTRDSFTKAGVQVLVGDWTRRDPAITRFLTSHGVGGVPLYLWYPKGGGAPQQLPQVLTADGLAELAAQ